MIKGEGSHVVLPLEGALDVATATEAQKRMLGLELRRGDSLVLDLSELTFMDSTGIRFILQARTHAQLHGASFLLVRGPEPVMRVLELVGLEPQLELVSSL